MKLGGRRGSRGGGARTAEFGRLGPDGPRRKAGDCTGSQAADVMDVHRGHGLRGSARCTARLLDGAPVAAFRVRVGGAGSVYGTVPPRGRPHALRAQTCHTFLSDVAGLRHAWSSPSKIGDRGSRSRASGRKVGEGKVIAASRAAVDCRSPRCRAQLASGDQLTCVSSTNGLMRKKKNEGDRSLRLSATTSRSRSYAVDAEGPLPRAGWPASPSQSASRKIIGESSSASSRRRRPRIG